MHVSVYVPLLGSVLLGVLIRCFGRRLPPAAGTWVLLLAGTSSAVATVLALGTLASPLVGQFPVVASQEGWSVHALERHDPVPRTASQLALIALGVITILLVIAVIRAARARGPGQRPSGSQHRLVVVDDPRPDAYAVPGHGGRVVVSTAMVQALTADERRVLLAHEYAHLRHRHHLFRTVVAVVVALDPVLVALPGAVRHLTERWADEDAAAAVGDRRLAAHALGRAALARMGPARNGSAVMGIREGDVPARVRSLLQPRRVLAPLAAATVVALAATVGVSIAGVTDASSDAEALFDTARIVHHTNHPQCLSGPFIEHVGDARQPKGGCGAEL